jgi:Undecaprenyl-phosphate galactose phosphotransferase WbaP
MSANPIAVPSPAQSLERTQSADFWQWVTALSVLAVDLISLSLVFALAVSARHIITPAYHLASYFDLAPLVIMTVAAFWVQGLYPGALLHPAEEMRRVFGSITGVFLVMACSAFLWRNAEAYSRSVFLVTWALGSPLVLLVRHFARLRLSRMSWWGIPAVVIGSGVSAHRVLRTLRSKRRGVRVIGVLSDAPPAEWPVDLPPFMGPTTDGPHVAKMRLANYAIVAVPRHSDREIRHVIQDHCRGFSHVLLIPDMPGLCSLGVSSCEVGGEMGLELPQSLFHRGPSLLKRLIDLALSFTGLVFVSPLFLILAAAIKATSNGPVFYRQTRYGRDGQTFKAFKFRTMVPNADRLLVEYLACHPEELFEWQRDHKLKNDPRVTVIGKWIRKFSFDELPQLLNVIIGQMSLVGPRPIVKEEIEKYGRGFELYARVRPGITGLWQVSGRNNTTYDERVAFDEFYVNNWSVWLDAYILFRTIQVVITAEGAY